MKWFLRIGIFIFLTNFSFMNVSASNIVEHLRWGWSENIGWINFKPTNAGVTIHEDRMSGLAWSPSHGWINFTPENGGVSVTSFLQADGRCMASLSGSAWGRNTGWIDFSETFIDNNGEFYGFAYGHITGKIIFGGDTFRLNSTFIPHCDGQTEVRVVETIAADDVPDTIIVPRVDIIREGSPAVEGAEDALISVITQINLETEPEEESIDESQDSEDGEGVAINYDDYSIRNTFSSCPKVQSLKNPEFEYDLSVYTDQEFMRHEDEVLKFAELRIANGYSDGSFGPGNVITRSEFLKMLFLAHCIDYATLNYKSSFVDIDQGSWQNRVVNKATELGIINGDTKNYDRNLIKPFLYHSNSGSSVQELKKVFNILGLYNGPVDTYYGSDFREAMIRFQLSEGIINSAYAQGAGSWGPGTQARFFQKYPEVSIPIFRPNDYITKIEALKILLKLSGMQANNPAQTKYIDIYTDWQKKYVETAQATGILSPLPGEFYHPNHGTERQDVVKLIYDTIQRY